MVSIERMKTGIKGLDELLHGGIPKGAVVLISGSAGSGKSVLSMQILINGCRLGEKGLYVSFEQPYDDIVKQASTFGWDVEKYIKKGLLKILSFDFAKEGYTLYNKMISEIKNGKYDRVVIDSLTALENHPALLVEAERLDLQATQKKVKFIGHENWLKRAVITQLINTLKDQKNTTSILISEVPDDSNQLSSDGVSEFLCDGVIRLYYISIGSDENRLLEIRKMRFTDHNKGVYPFSISSTHIKVSTKSTVILR